MLQYDYDFNGMTRSSGFSSDEVGKLNIVEECGGIRECS